MATITAIDYRRNDLRNHVWPNPYWISSGVINGIDSEDKGALLFSFPTVKHILVQMAVFQVITAFTVNTLIDVGTGTIATDDITTGGDITVVDLDEYIKQGDITVGTAGWYGSTTGNASDWLVAMIAGSWAAPFKILGAATTVPVVYATISNVGTIAAGTGRFHMLVYDVPGF